MDGIGPTIVGRRSTPGADAVRDLLTWNEVPHHWVDLDRDPLVPPLETESLSAGRLPLVLVPDGAHVEALWKQRTAAERSTYVQTIARRAA